LTEREHTNDSENSIIQTGAINKSLKTEKMKLYFVRVFEWSESNITYMLIIEGIRNTKNLLDFTEKIVHAHTHFNWTQRTINIRFVSAR